MAVDVLSSPSIRGPVRARSSSVHVSLIGGFEVCVSKRPLPIPVSAERVVALLALHDRPLHRHYVSGTLWPDTTDNRAAGNLRSSLWRLRRAGHPVVEITNRRLALRRDVAVDVREWIHLISRARDPAFEIRDQDIASIAAPADLLPGWYEDWVVIERERFRQVRLHGLEAICDALAGQRRFAAAVEAGMAVLREEPLRESGQCALIRAFLAEGNASEAVRQFRRYRQLLRAELGLEPSMDMERLVGVPITG